MDPWATCDTIGGKPVLRFVRRLAHPPEKVFRAISEPDELRHWFPARAELELRPGAPIRFSFEEHDAEAPDGEVLEVEAPRLLVLRWGDDVLRFEIVPEPGGCRLHFSQTLAPGGASGGWHGTARNAAGWHVCLVRLAAALDGEEAPADVAWFPLFEGYAERFGLVEGEVGDDGAVHFTRDVVATPAQVWALLTEDAAVERGAPAPRRFEIVPERGGCRLHFSQTLAPGGASGGWQGTARNAAGWHVCLLRLAAALDGEEAPADVAWFPLFEGYSERFGLVEGEVGDDGAVHFTRDVVATPAQVWALLTEDAAVERGTPAPRRFAPAPPGDVTAVEPERALACETEAGPVRWTLEPRVPGALIGVRQEVADPAARPAALAAWQVHLELLVAALQGIERCWPDERVAALEARYAARLAAPARPAARR